RPAAPWRARWRSGTAQEAVRRRAAHERSASGARALRRRGSRRDLGSGARANRAHGRRTSRGRGAGTTGGGRGRSWGRGLSYTATGTFSEKKQAARWSRAFVSSGGSWSAQGVGSWAIGQRVWKRQPDGGLTGEGISPASATIRRFDWISGSGIGMAERSAFVYGWRGLR